MEARGTLSENSTTLSSAATLPPEMPSHEAVAAGGPSGSSATAFLRRTSETQPVVAGRHRLRWLALALLIAVAGGYGAWRGGPLILRTLFGPHAAVGFIEVSGNIEAHQSVLSFTQIQAPIEYLPFDEGAVVARGTVLARVDDRPYRQQVEIDRTNLAVAAAQIAANESTLAAAQHSVASDRFDLAEKRQPTACRLISINRVRGPTS